MSRVLLKATITGIVSFLTLGAGEPSSEIREDRPVDQLLAGLRSDEIRELAKGQYEALFDRDVDVAKRAVDVFFDLNALALMSGALANANRQVGLYAESIGEGSGERSLGSLRSEEIRRIAQQRRGELMSKNLRLAKRAIDVFYDLKAVPELQKTLNNKNFEAKLYAVIALKEFVKPGDIAVVQQLATRLEEANTLVIGGTEVHLPKRQYVRELVSLISKLTDFQVEEIDVLREADLATVTREAREWAKRRQTTEEPE